MGDEETAFLDVIPKQLERKTCDPKVKFGNNFDFLIHCLFLYHYQSFHRQVNEHSELTWF